MAKTRAESDLRKMPKDERPPPTTGQSGPEVEVPYDELNSTELLLVGLLDDGGDGQRASFSVESMGEAIMEKDRDESAPRAKLLARNALRRLVCGGWVERVERARYRITEKGRKRLARVS
jgi:hypothetical protein